jgi:hypothetical protein
VLQRRFVTIVAIAGGLSLAAACADPSDPSGLYVVSGAGQTDTVDAYLAVPLVVRFADSVDGIPLLVFRAEPSGPLINPGVLISPVSTHGFAEVVQVEAGADGTATVWIRMGTGAGAAKVNVREYHSGSTTSAAYTVRPGREASVRGIPRDTAIRVGGAVQSRSQMADRHGNPVGTGSATVRYASGGVSVTGTTITGTAVGRAAAVARANGTEDTMWVSVVPPGGYSTSTLSFPQDFNAEIGTMDLDGRERRTMPAPNITITGLDWSPDGSLLAIDDQNFKRIRIADRNGILRELPAGEGQQIYPEYSPDGEWLYYGSAADGVTLRRIRPDGTGQSERVPDIPAGYVALTVSPDLHYFAVVQVDGGGGRSTLLRRFDRATHEWLDLAVAGHSPAWSPDGQWIAYVNHDGASVHVIRPDGTGERTLTAPGNWYRLGIDWSADGQWVLATSILRYRAELIHRDTGELLPLYSGISGAVAWRP